MYSRYMLKLNILALAAAGIIFVSTFYPWWGLDISGPYGISYSFHWTMWGGPLVQFGPLPNGYFWTNYLNQAMSAGTSILGTLALCAMFLVLVGADLKRTRFLGVGLAASVAILLLYLGVVYGSVEAAHNVWPTYTPSRGISGTLDEGFGFVETWGFQTGYYLYILGVSVAFLALVVGIFLSERLIRREVRSKSAIAEGPSRA